MVELNMDLGRPETLMDVSRLAELGAWRREDGHLFLGAGVTYTRIMRELPEHTALVQASRSVGRRRSATAGPWAGTSGPARPRATRSRCWPHGTPRSSGRGPDGSTRSVPLAASSSTGVKQTAREPDELILGAGGDVPRGPGSFSKIGTRNAMVIAVANLCLQVDEGSRRCGWRSGPSRRRSCGRRSRTFAAQAFEDAGLWDDSGGRWRPT